MRHRKKRQKLAKTADQRRALLRSLISAIILKEKIVTIEGKAKKIRPFLEKYISRAKEDTLVNRRFLLKNFSPKVVSKLMKELGPRYKVRSGGYCRINKLTIRKNDAARMVIMELIK